MALFHYQFVTEVNFQKPIYRHQFLLRCIPRECMFQRIVESGYTVEGATWLAEGTDAFGNSIVYGAIDTFHDRFSFSSEGRIEQRCYQLNDPLLPCYKYPTPLTLPSTDMMALAAKVLKEAPADDHLKQALMLSEALKHQFTYSSGTTDTHTSAAEAFQQHHGVCQDFAHIFIALCRLADIPARYVNGFLLGEGASHAWVEIYDNARWRGIDPTQNHLISNGYIKIAHGRDADDCPLNRGIYMGHTDENMLIKVNVTSQQ